MDVVETDMTLLSQAYVPNSFQTYALATTIYLINRLPMHMLSMEIPYQKMFQRPPNYHNLKILRCMCVPSVFLGYSLIKSAYLRMDSVANQLYVS